MSRKISRKFENIFIKLQLGNNIMANEVKTPIRIANMYTDTLSYNS
jgi:hypothetical protein